MKSINFEHHIKHSANIYEPTTGFHLVSLYAIKYLKPLGCSYFCILSCDTSNYLHCTFRVEWEFSLLPSLRNCQVKLKVQMFCYSENLRDFFPSALTYQHVDTAVPCLET